MTKKISSILIVLSMAVLCAACGSGPKKADSEIRKDYPDARVLVLAESTASLDGKEVEIFDYTWHVDPSSVHDDVSGAPAEYYTGTKPDTGAAVYIDHDLQYYPLLDTGEFRLVDYDGDAEWAYYYHDGENDEYIFATLPRFGESIPSYMMHSEEEAAENRVLHISEAGSYIIEGSWKGQIRIDLGEDAAADESARVNIIFNGADISCSVAPGIVFVNVCESGSDNDEVFSEEKIRKSCKDAGANIIIADGSENTVTGTNIFRMLKNKYKGSDDSASVKEQKKIRKIDGCVYSYMTMSISSGPDETGSLTVNSGFEGIDSEMHLGILSGNITVNSQDDCINVNEDGISAALFEGGNVILNSAQGSEGDGVDSNGYIVVDGGTLCINGVVPPDSALDSDCGVYYNGGTVMIDGREQAIEKGSVSKSVGSSAPGGSIPGMPGDMRDPVPFDIHDFKEKVADLSDDATLEDVLELLGVNSNGMQQRPDEGFGPAGAMPPEFDRDGRK